MEKPVLLSEQALKRLPRYLWYLKELQRDHCEFVTAPAVARHLGLNEVQVRKELSCMSSIPGRPRMGFLVDNLVEPPVRLPGDLTGDDEVNYSDALLLLRATINLATLTPEQEVAADFNGDGAINYMDALAILRDSIGL